MGGESRRKRIENREQITEGDQKIRKFKKKFIDNCNGFTPLPVSPALPQEGELKAFNKHFIN